MINQVMKKITYSLSILAIAFLPCLAVAQTVDSSTTDITLVGDTSADVTVSTTSPQQTTTSQSTIDSSSLENAANPQTGSSTGDTISTADASSTDIILVPAAPTSSPATPIPTTADNVVSDVIPQADSVATLPAEVLTPTKEYTFALSGESVATQQTPDWNQDDSSAAPSATVSATPSLDATAANILSVSGACSDPYFVILLYKNQEDYNNNPASYIFNKAYPCENGHYSYAISQLPFNLQSGTFYLLVAGQGIKGSWKPITALMPVGITVTTVFPSPAGESTTTDNSSLSQSSTSEATTNSNE